MLKSTNIYKAQRPTKAYLNHRENQRERILEVAESLFIRDGIDKVNLSFIARTARLIDEGIADGSVRSDLDTTLVSTAIWNMLSGMNARFSLLGDLIQQEYGQPVITIYHEICHIFLRGIHPTLFKGA
jgi:AcrR family transcriptional regulator